MKSFSFVIPIFIPQKDIVFLLKSLERLNYPKERYEIILINDDPNSSFNILNLNMFSALNLKVYKNISNGAASARNYGVNLATKEILIFLDQDVVVRRDLLKVYNKSFNTNNIEVIQGNIWEQIIKTKLTKIHSKWRKSVFINKVQDEYNQGFIKTIVTRNVAISKDVLYKIRKKYGFVFNEKFIGTGGEDRELGYRISKNYKIKLEVDAIVEHKDPFKLFDILNQKYRHARGDTRMGIGERFFDVPNFKRVVITPQKDGVPLYFSFLIWCFHIIGCEFEKLSGIFSRNHYPRGF